MRTACGSRVFVAAAVAVVALGACSSRAPGPTVSIRNVSGSETLPAEVVVRLRAACPADAGRVRLDLRQGDARLRPVLDCSIVRENASGAAAELVDLVRDRHDAARRADRANAVATALGVHAYDRSLLIWTIGTGIDGCSRVADVAFHRDELTAAATGANHESPEHWTKVEAARFAGTCPGRLDAFLTSVADAGQRDAASTVRAELVRIGVLPAH